MKRELTKRELEILKFSLYPYEDISKHFHISISTVKAHFHNIITKFNAKTREQSLMIALKYKLLGIKDIDIGFWDSSGVYIEDIQPVNFRRE